MSWQNEKVVLDFTDGKGNSCGEIEITKAEYIAINKKAMERNVSVNEVVIELLEEIDNEQ